MRGRRPSYPLSSSAMSHTPAAASSSTCLYSPPSIVLRPLGRLVSVACKTMLYIFDINII